MRLVQFGIRLDFAEERRIYTVGQKVHGVITGKIPIEPEPPYVPGTLIRVSKKKLAIVWEPEGCLVALEDVSNLDKCIKTILTTLEQISSAAPIYKLNKRRVSTYWILPTPNYDFPSLERKYREIMVVQNEISSLAYDSSVIFEIRMGNWTLHHQSGAMWPQQLLETYLQFKLDDIPKAFLFLEASIIEEKVLHYSSEEMKYHLLKSFDYCKSHSSGFRRIWEGIL